LGRHEYHLLPIIVDFQNLSTAAQIFKKCLGIFNKKLLFVVFHPHRNRADGLGKLFSLLLSIASQFRNANVEQPKTTTPIC